MLELSQNENFFYKIGRVLGSSGVLDDLDSERLSERASSSHPKSISDDAHLLIGDPFCEVNDAETTFAQLPAHDISGTAQSHWYESSRV